jgi:hypothetical protein
MTGVLHVEEDSGAIRVPFHLQEHKTDRFYEAILGSPRGRGNRQFLVLMDFLQIPFAAAIQASARFTPVIVNVTNLKYYYE